MDDVQALVTKYNIAAPRYTSYPTVPFWDVDSFQVEGWKQQVKVQYANSTDEGVSIYIHLPYCESLCTYCGCNTRITKNHQVEKPYIDAVLKEWSLYRTLLGNKPILIKEIHLGGGTPTFFKADNLKKLIGGILKGNQQIQYASFSFEAHPANTSKMHLEVLYDLGFRRLSLGIQDFDEHVQYIINRHQSVTDVAQVMKQARDIGYTSINFDLIYGLPMQTMETVRRTVEQSLMMSPDRISFYSYAHVPWIKPGQRRFTEHDLPIGQQKLDLYKLGKSMILREGYKDVGMDHFAKEEDTLFIAAQKGTLHRNFMGYADTYTPLLIGLGVSSISDAWTGFAQNVKTVEEYHKLLAQDRLPVFKGHLLHDEDLTVRRYILDIMCRGEVKLKAGFALNERIINRLDSLIQDGLVEKCEDLIRVTALGQSFLRNICMAFDQRLHQTKERENLFSQAI